MSVEKFLMSGKAAVGQGRVADQVHDLMLDAIVEGSLTSGQVIHDHVWAEQLGVSRTPVREAVQRLNGLGLLDVAPARFTRLISFTPHAAHQEAHDWLALHHAVISCILSTATVELLEQLRRRRHAYHSSNGTDRCAANFAFHQALRDAVPNFALHLGATACAYRFRLAEPLLTHDPGVAAALHTGIITTLETGTLSQAHEAMTRWARTLADGFPLAA